MTVDCLKFISETLTGAGIQYEFGEWTSTNVPSPFFVGEFIDVGTVNEDGMEEVNFIITGTSMNSWLELLEAKNTIEGLFPSIGGRTAKLDNGSMVAIFFSDSNNIPTDTMDLKRIQINLTIKEWRVN